VVPGPGAYIENASKTSINLSQFRKPLPKSFPKERRSDPFLPLDPELPGPGNYEYPSEFGVYSVKPEGMENSKTLK
jgi:hypothetical protein